jgi:glycosyltransferase involved in cell wall biosynthesis
MSTPLRVAILHYHLKRGGVTRVIESTIRGFEASGASIKCAVLAGESSEHFSYRDAVSVVPSLAYDNAQNSAPEVSKLYRELKDAARQALGGAPDIWHIHNHSLGKNSALSGVVALLAEAGHALLLQMHDFAEDGRPSNYALIESSAAGIQKLYPSAPQVHYAVLNNRDYLNVRSTGIEPAQLHCLPNPIEIPEAHTSDRATVSQLSTLRADRLALYPVRAVRRKNFGELLLWAACAQPGDVFATTLGPTNRNYRDRYEDWLQFARDKALPVRFSIAEQSELSFPEIMEAADCILTTSIAEGFGLSFLEPWLFGKSIVGRDLPAITEDFKTAGIQLGPLYNSLPIPKTWIDQAQLRTSLQFELEAAYRLYKIKLPENAVDRALSAITDSEEHIDFGGLDETLQQAVLSTVCNNHEAISYLRPYLSIPETDHSLIEQNQTICKKHFGLSAYAKNLEQIYSTIVNQSHQLPEYIEPYQMLKAFLKPESFRLLRT